MNMELNMTNDMHLGIEHADSYHPYGVPSESDCRLSAGVPFHSTAYLNSVVPTGLHHSPVGAQDIKQAVKHSVTLAT